MGAGDNEEWGWADLKSGVEEVGEKSVERR